MSKIGAKCLDCNAIFSINSDMLFYFNQNGINPYICPVCHSYNCRNMTGEELELYNNGITSTKIKSRLKYSNDESHIKNNNKKNLDFSDTNENDRVKIVKDIMNKLKNKDNNVNKKHKKNI